MKNAFSTILLSVSTALATICWLTFANPILSTDKAKETVPTEHLDNLSYGDLPYLGQINIFAGTFAPRGWAFCSGQILSIDQNQHLFALIGTTYGGDGRSTFALPDLRGRTPVGAGEGLGLTNRRLGYEFGREERTILLSGQPFNADASGSETTLLSYQQDPINCVQPSLGINYIIALEGQWPPRS